MKGKKEWVSGEGGRIMIMMILRCSKGMESIEGRQERDNMKSDEQRGKGGRCNWVLENWVVCKKMNVNRMDDQHENIKWNLFCSSIQFSYSFPTHTHYNSSWKSLSITGRERERESLKFYDPVLF